MTSPDEPTRGSDTGWPADPAHRPSPPLPGRTEAIEPADVPSLPVSEAVRVPVGAPVGVPVSEPVGAPVSEPEPPAPAAAGVLRSAPVLALLIMTVLMTTATAVVWYQVHRHDATENARRAGLETSRDAARVLFSYDYRTLSKDFAAGAAITTGTFRTQYADTTTKVVSPVAIEKKAVVKAEVVTAGVVRAGPDTVVTIVYVNQVTTSSLQTGPKVDLSRVRMTVKRVGGRWLISNVEAL